ncbi:MAG: nickel-dependent lactate racemase [Aigarchaeota archaeon]|nr:nickel-dependent lactate racemase [Aigarchaeota archaeon]MDH5702899.1 nickel-dependent lactate racemase [Aigarchaeota archaeon]
MKISFPWAEETKSIEVPDRNLLEVVHPKTVFVGDENRVVRESLRKPLNASPIEEFVQSHQSFLLVVNDATRPTPTATVFETLYPMLRESTYGVTVATGSHRQPTEQEYKSILGRHYGVLRERASAHDAVRSTTVNLGRTSFGTEITVNEAIEGFDALIVIGSVEPHYFAGFTGGRKGISPGMAAYSTIEANHKLALEPEAATLRLQGNPVHDDLEQCIRTILREHDIFAVNMVLDANHRVYKTASGHVLDSLYAAAEHSRDIFVQEVPEKADVVIAVTHPPLDINLYQAQKALENAKAVVRKNGILILVARCPDGIGPPNFHQLLAGADSPTEVFSRIREGYRLGYHKAAKIADMLINHDIYAVTNLQDDQLKAAFMKPFRNGQQALNEALAKSGRDATVLVLLDAGVTVPVVKT